ncbi:hypothetical protein OUZ56_008221 [Daphnia magna]|uniref:Uncharacterized protein n=1 Tax=Daphnia magna TaxID=35525 RepID=A0ABR0ACB0_9CRUS|nr:hypothetical protein OUZ56_008221 [Daphnia magna]
MYADLFDPHGTAPKRSLMPSLLPKVVVVRQPRADEAGARSPNIRCDEDTMRQDHSNRINGNVSGRSENFHFHLITHLESFSLLLAVSGM